MLKLAGKDTIPTGELSGDLCIIGTGAAGLVMAERFIKSGFKNVIVLESSSVSDCSALPAQYTDDLIRLGTVVGPDGHRCQDPYIQPTYDGSVTQAMSSIDPTFLTRSRIRVYGGTTNCWGGWTLPLAAADFKHPRLSPESVWPITRDELMPYYSEAVRYCSLPAEIGVDPRVYDDASWWVGKTVAPIEAIKHTANSQVRSVAFTVIGGTTREDEKWSFQKTQMLGPAIEAAPNVTIWRNANARRVVVSGGAVRSIEASTVKIVDGKAVPGFDFKVIAPRYVLAAGGIETVRLLLLSGRPGSSMLGKTFMVHPVVWSLAHFSGGKIPTAAVRNYYAGQPELRIDPTTPRARVFAAMTPTDAVLDTTRIGNFRAIVNFDGYGAGTIGMNWEQEPDPTSVIDLHPTEKDVFKDQRTALDWKFSLRDFNTAIDGAKMVGEELQALGYATDVTVPTTYRISTPGDHHIGATRMAASPSEGYVDANCRVHGIPNLYIASSSVFPTGGYANPTLTIIALAARLADHLRGS